jgi:hypothetical protein
MNRDSSVGIATSYWLEDWMIGIRFPAGLGIFLFYTMSKPALGPTQAPTQWVPGPLSVGVKRARRETDHSPPPSKEVKNARNYDSTSPYFSICMMLN